MKNKIIKTSNNILHITTSEDRTIFITIERYDKIKHIDKYWSVVKTNTYCGPLKYARTKIKNPVDGNWDTILMHKLLFDCPPKYADSS